MSVVYAWKVVGFRGWGLQLMYVQASNAREARARAREHLGFWLVLRTVAV